MFVVMTRMDDVSDAAYNVYGPFATKRAAKVWAKSDREKMASADDDSAGEVFYEDEDEIAYGEFVWAIEKVRRATMPKAKKPTKKKSKRA